MRKLFVTFTVFTALLIGMNSDLRAASMSINNPQATSPDTSSLPAFNFASYSGSLTPHSSPIFHWPPVHAAACGDPVNNYADCLAECHCDLDRCPYGSLRCQGNFNYCKADCIDWF